MDYEGWEVIHTLIVVLGGLQRMLEVLMPVFGTRLPCVLGQKHRVVVHQTKGAILLHHNVAVLQVVMCDIQRAEGAHQPPPAGGYDLQAVGRVQVALDKLVHRLAVYPLHFDNGIPVTGDEDALFDVLELHEGRGRVALRKAPNWP